MDQVYVRQNELQSLWRTVYMPGAASHREQSEQLLPIIAQFDRLIGEAKERKCVLERHIEQLLEEISGATRRAGISWTQRNVSFDGCLPFVYTLLSGDLEQIRFMVETTLREIRELEEEIRELAEDGEVSYNLPEEEQELGDRMSALINLKCSIEHQLVGRLFFRNKRMKG